MMKKNSKKSGMVLIVALWIIVTLAGMVLVFGRKMKIELLISANRLAEAQVEWISQGALAYAAYLVENLDENAIFLTNGFDCEAVSLGGGYFWFLKQGEQDGLNYSFGLIDESSKLNLNTASFEMFLMLPQMTDELAASIVDWRNPDESSFEGGAKSEYYLLLNPPYQCKNGPFETVEELLLVKGCSMEILFGEDLNRNGFLDENENDGAENIPNDNMDGILDRGIYDFTTVYSNQSNAPADQEAMVNINSANTAGLTELLSGILDANRLNTVMGIIRRGRPFENILDFYARTGLSLAEFRQISSELTVGGRGRREGLININTAPKEVIACLPGLEEADVYDLVEYRASSDISNLEDISWVAEVLTSEKAAEIGGWLTTRSYQFSVDIVAVSGDGKAFKRFRAVLDKRFSPPQVLSWQDLTGLGWPLAPEILTNLRKGISPYENSIF
ncbi:type II secretion system protein GspK [bacterium]|nr:type II secretion system protein GspK [bacterium]